MLIKASSIHSTFRSVVRADDGGRDCYLHSIDELETWLSSAAKNVVHPARRTPDLRLSLHLPAFVVLYCLPASCNEFLAYQARTASGFPIVPCTLEGETTLSLWIPAPTYIEWGNGLDQSRVGFVPFHHHPNNCQYVKMFCPFFLYQGSNSFFT